MIYRKTVLIIVLSYFVVLPCAMIMGQEVSISVMDYMQNQDALIFENTCLVKGHDFIVKGFCPLRVIIHNHSDSTLVLSRAGMRFPFVSSKKVIHEMKQYASYGDIAAIGIPIFLALVILGDDVMEIYQGYRPRNVQQWNLLVKSFWTSLGIGCFAHWYRSSEFEKQNIALSRALKQEAFFGDITIKPRSIRTVLLFVRTQDYYTDHVAAIELHDVHNRFNTYEFVLKDAKGV